MHHQPGEIAARLLKPPLDRLDAQAQKVARHVAERQHIARDLARDDGPRPTRG